MGKTKRNSGSSRGGRTTRHFDRRASAEISPPLPGEVWNFKADEFHSFACWRRNPNRGTVVDPYWHTTSREFSPSLGLSSLFRAIQRLPDTFISGTFLRSLSSVLPPRFVFVNSATITEGIRELLPQRITVPVVVLPLRERSFFFFYFREENFRMPIFDRCRHLQLDICQ